MPLVGMRCRVDAMLMIACSPNWTKSPVAASTTKRLVSCSSARESAQHDEGEQRDDDQADDEAELLAGHGEDEIGMRVGQRFLDRAFARPAAPEAAIA